ncbi:MAG: TRAP transporter small permease [Rhodospirillaceae bacterium]|jgi:TRAP-type C4-dicarboxylate transport system permease small subunit|nr:TRAP transporter small permease [Rhodospirillaceae bacterium]MBT4688701.1 TRAP transporter small permease [Rhodospirillaceae bacterium]MBT5080955.1 TRAP transporter small permease [Rhodospirillaceae bacterium]MBT5523048.1 TRAP transporter small permease [Rhodospirillaceae bacterium]MBT5881720.1 TRAP transporter small permease [Rhodospirillaceae bacterium]
MTKILDFVDAISKWFAAVAAVLMVSIAVMILSEITARSLFNYSLSFAWEYSAYAMGTSMFFGLAYTLRTGGHIRVSLLAASIPPRAAYWVDVVCTLFGLGIIVFITVAIGQLAWRSYLAGSVSSTISETPLSIPQAAISFGALLLALQLLARLIRLFTGAPTEDTSEGFQVE